MGDVLPIRDSSYKLTGVQPQNLHEVWDMIVPGLQIVARRSRSTWRPEDIYHYLKGGNASLAIAMNGSLYGGFIVMTAHEDPFTGKRSAVIWACYTCDPVVVDELLPQVERGAKEAGFSKVVFQTARRAWGRRLGKQGYAIREYIVEKEL